MFTLPPGIGLLFNAAGGQERCGPVTSLIAVAAKAYAIESQAKLALLTLLKRSSVSMRWVASVPKITVYSWYALDAKCGCCNNGVQRAFFQMLLNSINLFAAP